MGDTSPDKSPEGQTRNPKPWDCPVESDACCPLPIIPLFPGTEYLFCKSYNTAITIAIAARSAFCCENPAPTRARLGMKVFRYVVYRQNI